MDQPRNGHGGGGDPAEILAGFGAYEAQPQYHGSQLAGPLGNGFADGQGNTCEVAQDLGPQQQTDEAGQQGGRQV